MSKSGVKTLTSLEILFININCVGTVTVLFLSLELYICYTRGKVYDKQEDFRMWRKKKDPLMKKK